MSTEPFDRDDPKNWQDCPECGGTGEVKVIRDFGWQNHYTQSRYYECGACNATGWIPSLKAFAKAHQGLDVEIADLLDTTTEAAEYLLAQLEYEVTKNV